MRAVACVPVLGVVWMAAAVATAEPIRARFPEGPVHGFLTVSDLSGTVLAHGDLTQSLEKGVVASRLVFQFDDGSLYDETVRFTQSPVFRIVAYHLIQRGPSFPKTTDVEFDRSGRYRATTRPAPDKGEEHASGKVDVPADVSNGMLSILPRNLKPGGSATTHMLAFRPKPIMLRARITAEGTDRFHLGKRVEQATRFSFKPEVTGLTGVVAKAVGKEPPTLRVWIAQGSVPTFVRLEGPLYDDGPPWRVELATPKWE